MQEVLIEKLHQYITNNNPDLLIALQHEESISNYLKEKVAAIDPLLTELLAANTPAYLIEEQCINELTRGLRPSRFNYLTSILEEEFETDYYRLKENGILNYEVINLIEVCKPVFETFGFSEENESDMHLHYAITGAIQKYLEKK